MVRILSATHKYSLNKIIKRHQKIYENTTFNIPIFKVNKVNRRLLMHVTHDCSWYLEKIRTEPNQILNKGVIILINSYECLMIAKTCKSNTASGKVIYTLENPDSITYLGKKDILLNQLMACEKLINYAKDNNDLELIQAEINELRLMLDLVT